MHKVQGISLKIWDCGCKSLTNYDKSETSMAAAEQRSKFKFVSLQRTNFESSYKRDFSTLAEREIATKIRTQTTTKRHEKLNRKFRTTLYKKLNQFKLKDYSRLN